VEKLDELMESNEEAQKIYAGAVKALWNEDCVCRWLSMEAPCGRRPSRL
jgi:hypothetical protein